MKLRWPRFSMRFLLITMLVIGALLGIVGQELVRLRKLANDQRRIIAQLESKGAFIELQQGINRSYVEPLWELFEGKRFPDIENVHLPKGAFELVDIEEICRLENLRTFSIVRAGGNDAWLAEISKARRLERIYLDDPQFTPQGAHALPKGRAPLTFVAIFGFPVDDEFLRLIARQPALVSLAVQGEGISAAGLGKLRGATKLEHIQLRGGKNLGEGFTQLAGHSNLKGLTLCDLEWNDDDLASLRHLDSVTSLYVSANPLPKGILSAAAAMPNLRALQLRGDFDPAEPVHSLAFRSLEIFATEGRAFTLDGLMRRLAVCTKLTQIKMPNMQVTEHDLAALSELYRMHEIVVGGSPSKEAINEFQRTHPYCVYIDGQWGVFQPKIGINPAKVGGGGVRKDSIVPPRGIK